MVDFYKERYEAHYEKFGIEGSGGGDSKSIGLCELGILSKAGLKNFHSLLDFGCGIGRLTPFASDFLTTGSYLGSDISETAIDIAKKSLTQKNVKFILNDSLSVSSISSLKSNFDFISCFSVFTHLELEDFYNLLGEFHKITHNQSKLVCSFLDLQSEYGSIIFKDESKIEYENRYLRSRNIVQSLSSIQAVAKMASWKLSEIYKEGTNFSDSLPESNYKKFGSMDLRMPQWVGVFTKIS